jgi:hypothetical protein
MAGKKKAPGSSPRGSRKETKQGERATGDELAAARAKDPDAAVQAIIGELVDARERIAVVRRVLAHLRSRLDMIESRGDALSTFRALEELGEALGETPFRMPWVIEDWFDDEEGETGDQ